MPQKVSDLVQRCPLAKQVDRETVPEHIRTDIPAGRLQPGLLERPVKNTVDNICGREPSMRGSPADKQISRRAGPATTYVRDDSLAYIDRKRHAVMELALSANHQLSCAPAYVLEPDSGHFLRAKAKTHHEQQHRVVAPPDRIIGSNGFEQLPDLVRLQMARQVG